MKTKRSKKWYREFPEIVGFLFIVVIFTILLSLGGCATTDNPAVPGGDVISEGNFPNPPPINIGLQPTTIIQHSDGSFDLK